MDEVQVIVAGLRKRIAGIIAEQTRVIGALNKSEADRRRLESEKGSLEQENIELKRKIKALELSRGMESVSGGSKGARDRVNRLLREVDKCIALMNK